jgi:hypothetical protein
MVGDADGGDVAVDVDPFVVFGVLDGSWGSPGKMIRGPI